jgi:hypothetical protein
LIPCRGARQSGSPAPSGCGSAPRRTGRACISSKPSRFGPSQLCGGPGKRFRRREPCAPERVHRAHVLFELCHTAELTSPKRTCAQVSSWCGGPGLACNGHRGHGRQFHQHAPSGCKGLEPGLDALQLLAKHGGSPGEGLGRHGLIPHARLAACPFPLSGPASNLGTATEGDRGHAHAVIHIRQLETPPR